MKILIKFPTRGRREKFLSVLDVYQNLCEDKENTFFLITSDLDDPEMNNDELKEILKSYTNLTILFSNGVSKIEAINRDIEKVEFDWDIVLLASDDMIPQIFGYDNIIRDKMKTYYPDNDGVLWFNDGFKKSELNTLCILGKKYYDRFGYIYYPEYKSCFCDNEFMEVANILNKQTYIDNVIIKHEHPDWGYGRPDYVHQRNMVDYRYDSNLFNVRRNNNFYLNI